MIRVELELVAAHDMRHVPAAWFIGGSDPEVWIVAIAGWGVPMDSMELRLVPGEQDGDPAEGVLVSFVRDVSPAAGPRAIPHGLLGGRLYLPCRSMLRTALTGDEIAGLPGGRFHLMRPHRGCVDLGDGPTLAVADLVHIRLGPQRRWDRARRQARLPDRLLEVSLITPPSPEDAFREERERIGPRPLSELPPGDDAGPAGRLGRAAGQGLRRALDWLDPPDRAPPADPAGPGGPGGPGEPGPASGGPGLPGPVGKIARWTRQQLDRFSPLLEAARDRDVRRLLRLFERNPDEALRYALPMGDGSHRGLAPPAAHLTPHSTDFDASRLRRAGPADPWSIPDWVAAELRNRYRQEANRALGLGRHRRAAYIFAELLGDHASAAAALAAGHHEREAAYLYDHFLKRPLEAARCLERGGFLLEAARYYETAGELLKAGDLHLRIDRIAKARELFERAAERRLLEFDHQTASRILLERLRDPDRALAVLEAAWPDAPQAGLCLTDRVSLLGRLGRHVEVQQLVGKLRATTGPAMVVTAVTSLVPPAVAYPDAATAGRLRDAILVLAGNHLSASGPGDAAVLVRAVASLAPEDRLLRRDTERFLGEAATRIHARPVQPSPDARDLKPVREFRLVAYDDCRFRACRGPGPTFVAAGTDSRGGSVLVRFTLDGSYQGHRWVDPVPDDSRLVLAAGREPRRPLVLHWPHRPPVPEHELPASDEFPAGAGCGTPAWFPPDAVAAAYDENDVLWIVRDARGPTLILSSHAHTGRLLSSSEVDCGPAPTVATPATPAAPAAPAALAAPVLPAPPIHVVAQDGNVFLTHGSRLIHVTRRDEVQIVDFEQSIRDLKLSPIFTRMRVALALEDRIGLLWATSVRDQEPHRRELPVDLPDPLIAFTRRGNLLVLTPVEGRVYEVTPHETRLRLTFRGPGREIAALTRTSRMDEVMALTTDGRVLVYDLPPA